MESKDRDSKRHVRFCLSLTNDREIDLSLHKKKVFEETYNTLGNVIIQETRIEVY